MDTVSIVTSVLSLVAGVGVFLIACTMMSSNLEALGSKRLKSLFKKASKSKLLGVGVGTAATAVIQSSSATTVMVIGFVNAGIMTLTQAATVIFGANIGTTITGQLAAIGMFDSTVSTSVIFSAFAGIGAFILVFAKKDRLQKIGGITEGFGMLFVGLSLMSGSMAEFSSLDSVKTFLAQFENPFLLVLVGALLTAVIQSSSAMTSITIAMVGSLISVNQGIYITMGANIGTCVTALIAGLTSTKNAKRTAVIHLIFNISGVALFLLIGLFMRLGGINFGFLFGKMFPNAPAIQLSMFHTIFNVITVILVLPLTNPLVKLVTKIIPDGKNKQTDEKNQPRFRFIEEHMLHTPPIAVQQIKSEIIGMAETAMENFSAACDIVCTLDYKEIAAFRIRENQLNFLNNELAKVIAKLLKEDMDEKDRIYLTTAIRTAVDLERVGDYAENIVEFSDKLREAEAKFSDKAIGEIVGLKDLIQKLFSEVMTAYRDSDREALKRADETEDEIDKTTEQMALNHITRLRDGDCTAEVGTQYLSVSTNAERVADHFINMAKAIEAYR